VGAVDSDNFEDATAQCMMGSGWCRFVRRTVAVGHSDECKTVQTEIDGNATHESMHSFSSVFK